MKIDFRTTYLRDSSAILINVNKFLELSELKISVVHLYPENKVIIDTKDAMYYPWPANIELYKFLWDASRSTASRSAIQMQLIRSKAIILELKDGLVSDEHKQWHMSVILGSTGKVR